MFFIFSPFCATVKRCFLRYPQDDFLFLWTTNHTFPAFTPLLYLRRYHTLIVLASYRTSLLFAVIHAREVARVVLEMESHLPGENRKDV